VSRLARREEGGARREGSEEGRERKPDFGGIVDGSESG
jgi:hypothetical protein